MKRRLLALLLTLLTVLGMFPVTAQAASSEEEALGEIGIYWDGTESDYLSINGAVRKQQYTYYNYKSPTGETREIPCYCVNPNLKGVPQSVPAGSGIQYLADQKCTDTKVLGIVASGYPHRSLEALGLNSKYEAYYATKMALWCHLLSNWSVYDLKVNPGCADQAAAQRVLKAAKEIYQTGMYWTRPCLKNGNMTKRGGFCCQTRPIFRRNTGCLSRKFGEVWRQKARRLGILTIFKQALSPSAPG